MRRSWPALATLLLALSGCDHGGPETAEVVSAPPPARLASPEARQRGQKLFLRHCALCHGERGDGRGVRRSLSSRPRDFTDPAWRERNTPVTVYQVIRQGRRGTAMAGWKVLDEEQTWDLVAHLLSLADPGG